MLIENLVIYARKPYEDSEGRVIYHGYILPKESEHYSAQRWSGWDKGNGSATMLDFADSNGGRKFPTFKNIVITALNYRGNGGRAYQVLIPIEENENFYVLCDLREDTLMDVIFTQGIEKGGKLNGEFAFIRNGAQTNLVLVGSKDYETAKAITQKKKESRKITNKELKIGYKYSTHNGKEAVYLGSYYQIEAHSVGNSVKVSETPKTTHVFVKYCSSTYKTFEFKKTQSYTLESEKPVYTEEEAKKFFIEQYINVAKENFEKNIKDIEDCFMKFNEQYQDKRISVYRSTYKWDCESKLRKELKNLKEKAYENHRLSIINEDKKQVVMDKEYVRKRVEEATKRGEESIAEFDFYKKEGRF